jgi:membrane associated rhomboid family serine protease
MGIYDRDYYRKEGPSYLDSFALRGQMCKWLLIVNIAVFIMQLFTGLGRDPTGGPVTQALELVPQKVLNGEVWRLLTCAFVHSAEWTHIVFNMWFLFLFGGYVEDIYGRWEFLVFYLTAAVVASLAFIAQAALGFHLRMDSAGLGASGAIMGVTILCAFHFPRLTILLFFVLPLPVWAFAVFLVVKDSYGLLTGAGIVAFSAHLGGAAFGALYYQMHWRLLSFWPKFRSWKSQRSRPRLRVFRGEDDESREPVAVAASPPAMDVDEQLEAKLDAVLEKVARTGQSSLTDAEKQILLRASEIYKKRRT